MPDLAAKVSTQFEFGGQVTGADGFTVEFWMDDSFRSWLQIVRWNLHYRHWRALEMNARDLFTKVIRRKVRIWPRS